MKMVFNNPHFARTVNDRVAIGILLTGAQLAMWFEMCHVMSAYYSESTPVVYVHYILATLLYVNSLSNWYKIIVTRTDCDPLKSSVVTKNDAYCGKCHVYTPPRSHHCKICNVCIMKRDHHCWFSGVCIGYFNHRYYLTMITYLFIAATYSNLFHWAFVLQRLGHLGYWLPLCVFAPHVCALFGVLTLYEFLLATLTFIAMLCAIMFAWLLQIQLAQLHRGQTRYERKVRIVAFNNGFLDNIRSIMGERWYIAWLCPWITSHLPGNGIEFPVAEKLK